MVRKVRFVFVQLPEVWKRKAIKAKSLDLVKKVEESERLSKNDKIGVNRPSKGTSKPYQSYQQTIGSKKRKFSIQPKNLQFKIPDVNKMFEATKSYCNRNKIIPKAGYTLVNQLVRQIIRNHTQQQHAAKHACQDVGESDEQLIDQMYKFLDKYLAGYCSREFYKGLENIPKIDYAKLVCVSFNNVLEKSEAVQLKVNALLASLMSTGQLPFETFRRGFEEFLRHIGDIDKSDLWKFVAEQLAFFILNEVFPIDVLPDLLATLIEASAAALILKHLFSLIISRKGSDFLKSMWQRSGLKFTNFMSQDKVQSFVSENNLEFLLEDGTSARPNSYSYGEIHLKLRQFLSEQVSFDDVVKWISTSAGERVTENMFIRVLATAIFENSIQNNCLVLCSHSKLFQKYIDNNTAYELQCLYALQVLINKLKHPQGLLPSICNTLYQNSVFSSESFIDWMKSEDPTEQEGKDMALKQLKPFFIQLKKNKEYKEYI